ncbi:MAG: Unknown protein [uncultured Thiotrichaceae bacterium]|uniref:TMEM205-like domain-containing protein n=1 Tax=uncultured Thiotrichaceae bacterium TaxID=298394 RepID=A0A6S6TG01_9GAMM|nr:MAG: Unknown protein [uncultured Thiotrichaceae bacterium]
MIEALAITHSLLLGSMLFFAAIVAPSVFHYLPAKEAGVFLRGLFPRYYLWGIVLSLVMTVLAFFVEPWLMVSSLLVLLLFVASRQFLMPAINKYRDLAKQSDPVASKKFARLHRASVIINLVQMLILLNITMYLARLL